MKWNRINKGFAKTECEQYEMSICHLGDKYLYTAFARQDNPMNPLVCLGAKNDASEARELCEKHYRNKTAVMSFESVA